MEDGRIVTGRVEKSNKLTLRLQDIKGERLNLPRELLGSFVRISFQRMIRMSNFRAKVTGGPHPAC